MNKYIAIAADRSLMIWSACSIKLARALWLDESVAGFSDFIISMLYMHRKAGRVMCVQ